MYGKKYTFRNPLKQNINQIQKVIQGYNQTIFNESELSSLAYKIQSEDVTTNETTKEHIKYIKSKVNNNTLKIKSNICPKCGGSLVKRKGKYGEFLGCSNFPKCRYTSVLK